MARLRTWILLGSAALALAGCGAATVGGPDSSPEEIAAAVYRHSGPPSLTLYTMINNRSGSGAHTSLMVNGSQRVIFDPAGSVRLSAVPEANDVLYGITPEVEDFYARAHARETYHVRIQTIEVTPEVAEAALRLVQQNGAVAPARCAAETSELLSRIPGLEGIKPTWLPNKLADQFATLPGVKDRRLYEDDADDKDIAIAAFENAKADQPGQ